MHSGQIIRASASSVFFAFVALANGQSSNPTIVKSEGGSVRGVEEGGVIKPAEAQARSVGRCVELHAVMFDRSVMDVRLACVFKN
jgi:hypothetical protein